MELIKGGQIRAGRAFLRWSAEELADRAKLGVATVRRAEAFENPQITEANQNAIQQTLESAGIIFVEENGEGPGVRLKKDQAKLETAINASEDALASMDKTPSPKRALHEMKAAIAKDGRRAKGGSKP